MRQYIFSFIAIIYPDIDREMSMEYDKLNNQLVFTGKNNWLKVVLVRITYLALTFSSGYFAIENQGESILVRILGVIFMIISFSILLGFLRFKKPWFKKTMIRFTPDKLEYSYVNSPSKLLEINESEIHELNVLYKPDFGMTSLKIWLERQREPMFDFDIDSGEKEGDLFKVFGFFAREWGLKYFDIYPAREGYERFVFKDRGSNEFDLNEPFNLTRERSRKSQLEPSDEKSVIGSYIVEKQQGNIHIDYTQNSNEKIQAWGMVFVSLLLVGLFYFVVIVEQNHSIGLSVLFLGSAAVMLFLGLNEVASEYYLKFILDLTNRKIMIRNILWRWEGIAFDEIEELDFKGNVQRNEGSTSYSGTIELRLKNGKSRYLMDITSDYKGLDDETTKNSIYDTGVRLSQLIAGTVGVNYRWLDFSDEN